MAEASGGGVGVTLPPEGESGGTQRQADSGGEEERFQADLARALANSMETLELEKIRRQIPDRRGSHSQGAGVRSERSPSLSEEVITTEVCPRSRPEPNRKIEAPSSLPPPPTLDKRRNQTVENLNVTMGDNKKLTPPQDLISFISPPADKGKKKVSTVVDDLSSLTWDNLNANSRASVQQNQLKAVQKLFSSGQQQDNARPPQPFPRNNIPGYNPSYSANQFPHPTQSNSLRFQQNQISNFPNQNLNFQHQRNYYNPRQPMFNQTIGTPVQRPAINTFPGLPTLTSNSMVKSNSWQEESKAEKVEPKKKISHESPPLSDVASLTSKISETSKKSSTRMKAKTDSLIDLDVSSEVEDDVGSTTVSILSRFDPLTQVEEEEEEIYWSSRKSNFSENPYDNNDPFNYMEQQAELFERLEEFQEDDMDSSSSPPPIPRRMGPHVGVVRPTSIAPEDTVLRRTNAARNYENIVKKDAKIFECIGVERKPAIAIDGDVMALIEMVREVRRKFIHSDLQSNPGIVTALKIEATYPILTEVKLNVKLKEAVDSKSVQFTASIDTDLDMLVAQVIENDGGQLGEVGDFLFKVRGLAEYMMGGKLSDFDYVYQCFKYNKDVELTLVAKDCLERDLARTGIDDERDFQIGFNEISPLDNMKTLSYSELQILLQTLQKEADRISMTAKNLATCSERGVLTALRPNPMIQAVKAVSALLGGYESLEVKESCERFIKTCDKFEEAKKNPDPKSMLRPEIVENIGERKATVILNNFEKFASDIESSLKELKTMVENMIKTYARTFRVDFTLDPAPALTPLESRLSSSITETLLVRVCCLHRLDSNWSFDDYRLDLRLYHGTKIISGPLSTGHCAGIQESNSLHKIGRLDHWLELPCLIKELPREVRLTLSLVGRSSVERQEGGLTHRFTELGWASLQMFSHSLGLAQGAFLLPLWPVEAIQQIGPSPDHGSHPRAETCPLISLELPELGGPVNFPSAGDIHSLPTNSNISFSQLDKRTQEQLLSVCDTHILSFSQVSPRDRELLWEKRDYLVGVCGALPKVLLAAADFSPAALPTIYSLLDAWGRPKNVQDTLQLLLPIFPDSRVRSCAVSWLAQYPPHTLLDLLPQLVEAVKHETYPASPLTRLLIERSLESPRVAHSLYWLLTQAMPGLSPQNSVCEEGVPSACVARYHRRLQLLLRAVFSVAGEAVRNRFLGQQVLMKGLTEAARAVQGTANGKNVVLVRQLETVHHTLGCYTAPLPTHPSHPVSGLAVGQCTYFNSNTFPLKLVFTSLEGEPLKVIFKVGDDLRQDMLTLQMIRVLDGLWLKGGIDLRMVSFRCVPTGWKTGVVEFVEDAKTLRDIQVTDQGVTGSFKPEVVLGWLQKHNQSPLEFESAINNFTRSCAGYSVVTYILGICDRHNDNIMVKTSGHLFHIDFGKFLGDAQKFGAIKRDRVPFVLTPDMVYVINGGDKMTQKFHTFVDLCCEAFNCVRASGNLLLTLFALMASSGIPGVTKDAVSYVQQRLFLDLSDAEAAAKFSQLIHESMRSVFTQFNFFVHNLAQLKFGSEAGNSDPETLSFIPKKYSLATDGRIVAVEVHGIQKRYDGEKYYVFILKVSRAGEGAPNYIFRTYKEFFEFHSALCVLYPLTKFTSLTKGLSIGRSEVREVAERRKNEIGDFLSSLFRLSDEISHSDLVYTFFHPLHRDQEEANIHIQKLKEPKGGHVRRPSVGRICGKLKMSIYYRRDTLMVMIHHIQNLAFSDPTREEPNAYVKVYLQPDPTKQTKRKTKIVKKNCNPSFMEMLEYRIPLEVVKCRTLQATVWDSSQFQENMFLGSVQVPLGKVDLAEGLEEWYSLGQFQR